MNSIDSTFDGQRMAQLDRVNQQIKLLYGPLSAFNEIDSLTWQVGLTWQGSAWQLMVMLFTCIHLLSQSCHIPVLANRPESLMRKRVAHSLNHEDISCNHDGRDFPNWRSTDIPNLACAGSNSPFYFPTVAVASSRGLLEGRQVIIEIACPAIRK